MEGWDPAIKLQYHGRRGTGKHQGNNAEKIKALEAVEFNQITSRRHAKKNQN